MSEHREPDTPPVEGSGQAVQSASNLPSAPADPELTLPAKRLAGSGCCLNCGTPLQGPFCHYCGQPDRNFLRFFPVLLRELMEEGLGLSRLQSEFTETTCCPSLFLRA